MIMITLSSPTTTTTTTVVTMNIIVTTTTRLTIIISIMTLTITAAAGTMIISRSTSDLSSGNLSIAVNRCYLQIKASKFPALTFNESYPGLCFCKSIHCYFGIPDGESTLASGLIMLPDDANSMSLSAKVTSSAP